MTPHNWPLYLPVVYGTLAIALFMVRILLQRRSWKGKENPNYKEGSGISFRVRARIGLIPILLLTVALVFLYLGGIALIDRSWGKLFNVVVVHGGPGASGGMAPVARELCIYGGVLEPLQTAISLEGQVEELKTILKHHGNIPVILIGHSWGAWLVFIFASQHPSLAKKLILVGSGPFEEKYAKNIMKTRLNRLDEKDRSKAQALMENLKDSAIEDKNTIMTELGKLISKADSYYSLPHDSELLGYQYHVYQNVWPEADELRRRGKLLKLGEKIQCPVIAIHGDYDPHPSEGVKNPLSQTIKDFRFILLKNCGHKPWIERSAKDRFYEILKEELSYSNSKLPDIA